MTARPRSWVASSTGASNSGSSVPSAGSKGDHTGFSTRMMEIEGLAMSSRSDSSRFDWRCPQWSGMPNSTPPTRQEKVKETIGSSVMRFWAVASMLPTTLTCLACVVGNI